MMIRCKLDVTKVLKQHLFKGEKGTYLDITLMENRDGPDKYGNDYFIVQDIGREARERGEKGPILGNGKKLDGKQAAPKPQHAKPEATAPQENPEENIPF